MESRQKYIEVEAPFELDESFVDGIMELHPYHRLRVLRQINAAADVFGYDEENTLEAGGRIGNDLYYKIEYYNHEGWACVMLTFEAITCDEYLDLMVDNKLILA